MGSFPDAHMRISTSDTDWQQKNVNWPLIHQRPLLFFFAPHSPVLEAPRRAFNWKKKKNAASRLHRCRRPSIINVDEPLQGGEPVHVYGTGCRYYGAELPSQQARGQKHRPPPFNFFVLFFFLFTEILHWEHNRSGLKSLIRNSNEHLELEQQNKQTNK